MNLVDCHVTEITGPPRELYGKWWVPVNYESWGCPGKPRSGTIGDGNSEIMCKTLEEAEAVKVGDMFLQ